jgi:hypothetical protein
MSTTRRAVVIIDGEEHVTEAARRAEKGLGGFVNRLPTYTKVMATLTAAYFAIRGAIDAVTSTLRDSARAFDDYEASQRKLGGTSQITGVSIEVLAENARRAREEFRLSRVQAADLSIVTALIASKAGDASQSFDLLSKAIELGAARGFDATEVMHALQITLRGQDEGLDKLVNRNPSDIYREWAASTGVAVTKMTDAEKALAVMEELLVSGGRVVGTYGAFLETTAGKQFVLNNALEDARIRLGQNIEPLRRVGIDLMTALATGSESASESIGDLADAAVTFSGLLKPFAGLLRLVDMVLTSLVMGVGSLTVVILKFGAEGERVIANFATSLGEFVEAAGDRLGFFGEGMQKAGDEMARWGRRTSMEARLSLNEVAALWEDVSEFGVNRVEYWRNGTVPPLEEIAIKAYGTGKAAEEAAVLTEGAAEKQATAMQIVDGMIAETAGTFDTLKEKAGSALKPEPAQDFSSALDRAVGTATALYTKIRETGDGTEEARRSAKELSRTIASTAREGLELAGAFGVIDDDARAALGSVITMGESLARVLSGDMTSIGGVVGAAANLVQQVTAGDAERRRLLHENSSELARLTREVGNLDISVSSDDLSAASLAAQGALMRIMPNMSGREAGTALAEELSKQGMLFGDLEAVADALGIDINRGSPMQLRDSLGVLLEAIRAAEPGRVGESFDDQLRFFRDSQRIDRAEGLGALQGLADFIGTAAPALRGVFDMNDVEGTRARLQALRTAMNNGTGLSGDQLGRVTGGQFLDLLNELLFGLNDLQGDDGTGGLGGGGAGADAASAAPPNTVPMPPSAAVSVVDAVQAQTEALLAPLQRTMRATEATALAATTIVQQLGGVQVDITASGVDAPDRLRDAINEVLGALQLEADRAGGAA